MKDLREYFRYKVCLVGNIVERRIKWAGHFVRMKDERLTKKAEMKKQGGCRKRGIPQLRWGDCLEMDQRKAEEEEQWAERPTTGSSRKNNESSRAAE